MKSLSRRQVLEAGAFAATAALLPAPLLARAGKLRLKFGNDLPAAHPVNVRLREAIAAISTETGGDVAIELFPNNQLGGDPNMLAQIRSGALELATFPGTVMSTLVPVMSLPGIGFAYTGYDAVWASMDGDLGEHLRSRLTEAGLQPFKSAWDNGFRQITSSTKPIATPADLAQFKIRVPVVPMWVAMFKSLGAAPVSMPLNEAYTSLQTHIADGQENPLSLINIAKFYEVQKYCALTNHAWDGFWMVANDDVWRRLPLDVQNILARHFDAAALKERDDIAFANVTLRQELESKGLIFASVEPGVFRKVLRESGFYGRARERFGADAWALLEKYTGELG